MKKELIKKTVELQGLTGELKIFEEVKLAIEKNWNSLYFSSNNITFASVKFDNYGFYLSTDGDVQIVNVKTQEKHLNTDEDVIRNISDNKLQKNYEIHDINWFSIGICEIERDDDGEMTDVEGYEDHNFTICFNYIPSSIEEFEKCFLKEVGILIEKLEIKKQKKGMVF